MGKHLSIFAAGLLFGLGLTISQMINPAKVISFLDILGNWDPSLAFVMGAALAVTFVGYRLTLQRKAPFFAETFNVPTNRVIDARLATGAVMFGAGWGLVGLCPGPAMAAISVGGGKLFLFVAAMLAGSLAFEFSPLKPKA